MASLQFLFVNFAFAFVAFRPAFASPAPQTTLTPVLTPITSPPEGFNAVVVPGLSSAGEPVLESFVSFSIEFAFFPDFAGNKSAPNVLSKNLLESIGELQGSLPNVRVGGNTQ
jgi:hypothetical protein